MDGILAACRRNWDKLPEEVKRAILAYDAMKAETREVTSAK